MAALTKQAGDAAQSAHNAATDAGNAKAIAKSSSDIAGVARQDALDAQGKADAAKSTSNSALRRSGIANAASSNALSLAERAGTLADRALKRTQWREIDFSAFQATLKGAPKANIQIVYISQDEEVYNLALQLKDALNDTRPGRDTGWTVSEVRPLQESDSMFPQLNHPEVPLATKAGAWGGCALIVLSLPQHPSSNDPKNEPRFCSICALKKALLNSGLEEPIMEFENPRMASNTIKVVIGHR